MSDWYRTAELSPPMNCPVRVEWFGTIFNAERIAVGERGIGITWATRNGGRVVHLPIDGTEEKFGYEPPIYQPLDPANYPHPLPLPVDGNGKRKDPAMRAAVLPRIKPEWWRDGGLVRRSPPGAVTPREAEGRVMRALMVEASMPRDKLEGGSPLSFLARMVELVEMAEGKRPTYWHDRFQPTARDLSDIADVVPWLVAISVHDSYIKVLRMRAVDPAYSWRSIAEEIDVSQVRVREIFERAVAVATRVANGQRNVQAIAAAQNMRALRERNRLHALRG